MLLLLLLLLHTGTISTLHFMACGMIRMSLYTMAASTPKRVTGWTVRSAAMFSSRIASKKSTVLPSGPLRRWWYSGR